MIKKGPSSQMLLPILSIKIFIRSRILFEFPKDSKGIKYAIYLHPGADVEKIKMIFPNEKFSGTIDDLADMVDQNTRMVKLRVSINNNNGKLKAGMFAAVSFSVNEQNNISVNKNALITVQAKNYVFIKTAPNTFEKKEVAIGNQIGDRIIIFSGLKTGEQVAIKGVMQLKGLSFGY